MNEKVGAHYWWALLVEMKMKTKTKMKIDGGQQR